MYFWKVCNGQVPRLPASFGISSSFCVFVLFCRTSNSFSVLLVVFFVHFCLNLFGKSHPKTTVGNVFDSNRGREEFFSVGEAV